MPGSDNTARDAAMAYQRAPQEIPLGALHIDADVVLVGREWARPPLRHGTLLTHDEEVIELLAKPLQPAPGANVYAWPVNRRIAGTPRKDHPAARWLVSGYRRPDLRDPALHIPPGLQDGAGDDEDPRTREARLAGVYMEAGDSQLRLAGFFREHFAESYAALGDNPRLKALVDLAIGLLHPATGLVRQTKLETLYSPGDKVHISIPSLGIDQVGEVVGPAESPFVPGLDIRAISTRDIVAEYHRRAAAGYPGTEGEPGDAHHGSEPAPAAGEPGRAAPGPEAAPGTAEAPDDETGLPGWFVMELMGHRRLSGYVRETTVAGAGFLRIDVVGPDGKTTASPLYPPTAVYGMTPTTEESVRRAANPAAFTRYALPEAAGVDDEDGDEDDPE